MRNICKFMDFSSYGFGVRARVFEFTILVFQILRFWSLECIDLGR